MRAIALLLLVACADDPEPNPRVVCGDGERADFESCDDGNDVVGDGCSRCQPEPLVTVRWRFYPTVGGEPLAAGCASRVHTVELVTEVNTIATYACADRTEGTLFVPPSKRVLARLRDVNGEVVAESLPKLPSSLWNVNAEFYEDGGWVRAWFPRDCAMSNVVLQLVPVDGGPTIYQASTCPPEPVVSILSGVAKAGVYDVTLTTNHVDRTITGVTVQPNSGVTDLEFR
jgi:cysteine-rich repeat protein